MNTPPELLPRRPPLEPVPLEPLPAQPHIAVVVPSFQQGKFIRDTIDSILTQDYRPLTIHVVDGGSTDETVSVLKSFGDTPELNWVSEPDRGVVHAVNKGFAKVRGDLVAIQSSDDTYCPGVLRRIVEAFQQHPTCGLLYGDTVKIDAAGNDLLRASCGPYSLENFLLKRTWIPQPSAFFRREMLEACGGWDERIPYAPDTDLWLRMAFRTQVLKLDEFLSHRRMHESQRDNQKDAIVRDYILMVEQSRELAESAPELQRAARAGCQLMRIRYNTRPGWSDVKHKWRARQLWPGLVPLRSIAQSGVFPVRAVLSRIKCRLLGRS